MTVTSGADVVAGTGPRMARRTVGDQAADHVRGLIVDGHLRPGERVPQAEIAAAFGISRTPLREALVVLEREGWLTIEPHRGAFVNALDARSISDHYRLYGLLLGFAVTLAVERCGDGLADTLDDWRRAFGATADSRERSRVVLGFNRTLLEAAGSFRLRQVLRMMRGLPLEHYFDLVPAAAGRQERLFAAVVAAVRDEDVEAAAAAYAAVMADTAGDVIRVLDRRGVIGAAPADRATTAGVP